MPSRTDSREFLLRGLALLALGVALVSMGRPLSAVREASADAPLDLSSLAPESAAVVLARRAADAEREVAPLDVEVAAIPSADVRAVLQSAHDAGVPLAWRVAREASPLPALGLSATTRRDPEGGVVVRAHADSGTALVLRDTVGWLDSATVTRAGVTWTVPGTTRSVCVEAGGSRACATTDAPAPAGRLRLYATPGWEAQFTMRALEEAGYALDARLAIAPRVAVRAGRPESLDTARNVAVIALDSAAWPDAAAIAAFVRTGGGLVVTGAAAAGAPRTFPLAGAAGRAMPAVPGALRGAAPREGLPLHALRDLASDAVVLERSTRPGQPVALAARRLGAGRVVQAGWAELWEWRLLGDDAAVQAHRDWWRTQVARAAGASPEPVGSLAWYGGDAAPLADLLIRAGPPRDARVERADAAPSVTPALPSVWWLVLASSALVGEWWLRRRRGAR